MRAAALDDIRSRLPSRDLEVLGQLRVFRLLTTRQLQRSLFPCPQAHVTIAGATRATHRVLSRLEGQRLVERLERRIGGAERGSAGTIWELSTRGFEVASLGLASTVRKQREPSSPQFVRHTIGIAELAATITDGGRERGLELVNVAAEPESWQTFLGEHGQPESLRPDLYTVTADSEFEQHTFWEWDLATEHGPALVKKCLTYQRFAALGAAKRMLGVVPHIVWVVPTAARARFIEKAIARDHRLDSHRFAVTEIDGVAELAFASLGPGAIP